MSFYPQLSTGAVAPFPVELTRRFRTAVNETEDGRLVTWPDFSASKVVWDLKYRDLLPEEWTALNSLFDLCEGRLRTFTFCDPLDNLLSWSEDFSQPAWVRDPLLSVSGGNEDPLGGTAAYSVTNGGAANQRMTQSAAIPGGYVTTLSLWARASSGQGIDLMRLSGAAEVRALKTLTPSWQRVAMTDSTDDGSPVHFGIVLPPGGSVQIFGIQAEAQPAASDYKMTSQLSGVYTNARFEIDSIVPVLTAPGRVSTKVRVSAVAGI